MQNEENVFYKVTNNVARWSIENWHVKRIPSRKTL